MPKLTEEQKQYIKEHPLESPYGMARKFGCNEHSVYYYLHKFHGESFLVEKKKRREEIRKVARELYPDYSSTEIERMTGFPAMQVGNAARKMGVRHTKETSERIYRELVGRLRLPESCEKRCKMIRRAFMADRIRAYSGMRQKTNVKFGHTISGRQICARGNLVRKYNYFYDKDYGDYFALFYDSKTERLPEEKERYYSEKYHFKFLQADE